MGGTRCRLEALEDLVESQLARLIISSFVKDYSDVSSDPLEDLFNLNVGVLLFEEGVDRRDKGGDRGWVNRFVGEPSSDGVCSYAFNKACWSFPQLDGRRKGGNGGFQIRSGNDVEEGGFRSPRELLRDSLITVNSVLDLPFRLFGGWCIGTPFG